MFPKPHPHSRVTYVSFLYACTLFVLIFNSCKKESTPQLAPTPPTITADPNDVYRIAFSKVLAKAVNAEPGLRSLIKAESVRQFDNDYDILYQAVKDKKLDNGKTVHETLLQYAGDANAFNDIPDQQPLLTIYVPELPNFDAERWNAQTQIPLVATWQRAKSGVGIYDADGKENFLEGRYIPGGPLLVVKTNERLVTGGSDEVARRPENHYFSNARYSFSFLDQAFNGAVKKAPQPKPEDRQAFSMDQTIVDAYNSGDEWHRDFIYYGITPTNTTGKFSNHYSETITSFAFTKPEQLGLISDHADDPKPRTDSYIGLYSVPRWYDGHFEIRISVFINAKNAVGQELKKYFTATGSELFRINYDSSQWIIGNLYRYTYKSVTPVTYYPNIDLVPWDLEQYGSVWKFVVSEYDPSEEVTRTVSNTTTYSANFEISPSLGDKIKIGAKFGASTTSTHTETYTYKTTLGSDELAEGVLDFRYPVITKISNIPIFHWTVYETFEVSTGIVTFSVEPKKIY